MTNVFVNPDDEIEVRIVVSTSKTNPHLIYADVDEKILQEIHPDDLGEINTYTVWFKVPNYSDMASIVDNGVEISETEARVNPAKMRLGRLCRLIKRWDLTGTNTPATTDDIKKLQPVVANVIGYQLDKILTERGLL